jgi:hypothetical protein
MGSANAARASLTNGEHVSDLRIVSSKRGPAQTAAADPTGGPNPLKALSSAAENFQGWGPAENRGS